MTQNPVQEILTIFQEYFGEEFVEKQDRNEESLPGIGIVIYYPSVVVTNEKGQSETIFDVFIRVPITDDGHLVERFQIKRSTYTMAQAYSKYTHSHISPCTPLGEWGRPCTGTGPINNTMLTLESFQDSFEDIVSFWELFCREIDDFIRVESIAGGPYIRMETISVARRSESKPREFLTDNRTIPPTFSQKEIHIAKHLLKSGRLKWAYNEGIKLAMSDTDFALLATREAYLMCKQQGYDVNSYFNDLHAVEVILTQGHFLVMKQRTRDILSGIGTPVITFKEKPFLLTVTEPVQTDSHTIPILGEAELKNIKDYLLYITNVTHGKSIIAEDAVFL